MFRTAVEYFKTNVLCQVGIVLVLSLLVRVLYLLRVGLLTGGDSWFYLAMGRQLAQGDVTLLKEYPFHFLYPATLALGHLLGLPERPYIIILHLLTSSALPIIVYFIVLKMTSKPGWLTLFVGLVVCFYPNFVFWTPYILTETLHLFTLGIFALFTIIFLNNTNIRNFLIAIAAGVVFGLSRPSAIPVFVGSVVFLTIYLVYTYHGKRPAALLLVACVTCLILTASYILYKSQLREKVLIIPTVYQSLWLSTRVTNSNIDHIETVILPPAEVIEMGDDFQRKYKIDYAINFITNHPFRYLSMAAERFISFWYPWLFARWSRTHIFLDAFLSFALTLFAAFSLRNEACQLSAKIFLLGSALTLAILTSFSQIDSDGRYRLPAELLLIPLMTFGIPVVLSYVGITIKRRSGEE